MIAPERVGTHRLQVSSCAGLSSNCRKMSNIRIPVLTSDRAVARAAGRHTNPAIQAVARAATLIADEHLLYVAAASFWLLSRGAHEQRRAQADHMLLTVVASCTIPHLLKRRIDQQRPDRCEVGPDRRGVRKSGNAEDAFPSGHATHIGAIASALCGIFPDHKPWILLGSATLAATRVAVLAHWLSDVVAGLLGGVLIERSLRLKSLLSRFWSTKTSHD